MKLVFLTDISGVESMCHHINKLIVSLILRKTLFVDLKLLQRQSIAWVSCITPMQMRNQLIKQLFWMKQQNVVFKRCVLVQTILLHVMIKQFVLSTNVFLKVSARILQIKLLVYQIYKHVTIEHTVKIFLLTLIL